jgi:hypothetical protein
VVNRQRGAGRVSAAMERMESLIRRHGPRLRAALGSPVVAIVALLLLSRGGLLVVGLVTQFLIADPNVATQADPSGSLLCRHDCLWYLRIIDDGYSTAGNPLRPGATSYAFFPLFPLLAAALRSITGLSSLDSALIVANAAFLLALIYIYHYARLLGLSNSVALTAVALLCFVPQSIVFSAAYTESLFLLLFAMAAYHLRREQYLLSGIAAAMLSAVRANGIIFVVFALAWIIQAYGLQELVRPWRRPQLLVPVFLAPLGLFLFWTFSFVSTGDAFAQVSSSGVGWGWRPAFPVDNIVTFARDNARSLFWLTASLIGFALSLLLLRRRLYAEFAVCLAMFVLLWSGQVPNSLLRYTIVLFPIWIGLAGALDRRPLATVVVFALMSLVNGALMVAWTLSELIAI